MAARFTPSACSCSADSFWSIENGQRDSVLVHVLVHIVLRGDPALSALQPASILAYSCYPWVAYAFSLVVYGSPIRAVPHWKAQIMRDLDIKQQGKVTE